jgi:hypothetical protein
MRSVDDYLALIPPLYAKAEKFKAVVALTVAPFADLQAFLADLPRAFDIDFAEGVQLDAVGAWVGQSRNVAVPVSQPWFSWGVAYRGWGQGYWKGPDRLGDYIASLDDDTYRRLLYAIVIANYGDGQVDTAQAALSRYFSDPATNVFVVDVAGAVGVIQPFSWGVEGNGWGQAYWRAPGTFLNETQATQSAVGMHWMIGVSGRIPTVVDLEILAQNLIRVTPAGVYTDIKVVTVDNTPLFGWGLMNEFVSGWGHGSWGAPPDFVAQNII